jgi:Mrp family chromosome partitioning ATPase
MLNYKPNLNKMKTNLKGKMIFKSVLAFGIICILAPVMSSCGNSSVNATNKSENTELSTTKSTDNSTLSTVAEALAKAVKDENSVFLVVTDSNKTDINKALEIAAKANSSVKKSVVIKLDRGDKNNKDLVTKYGLAGAPLPVLLVISPKGNLAGGYLLIDASVDVLVKQVPTPKQDEVLSIINNKKSVFIVASKSSFTDKEKVIENCKAAIAQNGNKTELIEIDLSDAKEKPFLDLLKVNTATTTTVTIVLNSKGQANGTFYEPKDAASLVTLANKVASSCCSNGKSCGK